MQHSYVQALMTISKYILSRIGFVVCLIFFSSSAFSQCSNTSYGSGVTCVKGVGTGGSQTDLSQKDLGFFPDAGTGIIVAVYQCWDSNCATTGTTTMTLGDNLSTTESCFVQSPRSPFTLVETGAQHLQQYMWFCPKIPSGITRFTVYCKAADGVTPASSCNYITITATEWTGLTSDTANPFDTDGGAASTAQGTTATDSTARATKYTNELIYTFFDNTQDDYACAVSPSVSVLQFYRGNINTAYLAKLGGSIQQAQITWKSTSCSGANNTPDDWYGTIAAIKTAASVASLASPTNLKATVQ